jgi:hypothetical protein
LLVSSSLVVMVGSLLAQMEELKRQQGDKLERLRDAEATVQSLQALVQAKGAAAAQQQQQEAQAQRSTLERCAGELLQFPLCTAPLHSIHAWPMFCLFNQPELHKWPALDWAAGQRSHHLACPSHSHSC